ncbi:MAG: phosphate signaling complex protein PhoU [Actinobacteria bacterium]|nr:phosphate signaling complex protein PhoU [Actinomycetota bacterium]
MAALRHGFTAELDQLRLQAELMAVRVDQNLERMRTVLATGAPGVAEAAVRADDDVDAMNVSLTERCYDLIAREQPVAGDLRFVVSVLRILGELERVGDLALRVVKLAPEWDLLHRHPASFDLLESMADVAVDQYRLALRAWATQELTLAHELVGSARVMDPLTERLMRELLALEGPDAVPCALRSLVAGRSLDRIADHAAVIGARLRYLLTGDPDHLATEIR